MEWVFGKPKLEKEFDEISCAIQDIQICLDCGSDNINVINNEIQCNRCGKAKSKCEVSVLV